MKAAFKVAHKHMRRALEKRYEAKGEPLTATPEGFLVESDGQPCDGGATATVAALIEGHLLIVANVGDSDCVIGGALPDAPLTGCSDAEIGFDQLNKAPTTRRRMATSSSHVHNLAGERPDGWEPANFVYDTSGSEYDAEARGLLEIFAVTDDGNVDLADVDATLTECDVGYKSKRGDRPRRSSCPRARCTRRSVGSLRSLIRLLTPVSWRLVGARGLVHRRSSTCSRSCAASRSCSRPTASGTCGATRSASSTSSRSRRRRRRRR